MTATLADVARVLELQAASDGSYRGRCPAHEDRSPSLSVAEKDGKLLFRCFTGCTFEAIRAAVEARGLVLRDQVVNFTSCSAELAWTIRDASGKALAQHVRIDKPEGKIVFWRGPAGERSKLEDLGLRLVDLPPYGVELLASKPADAVVICEGEKAADAARELGLLALGTSTGASSAPKLAALEALRGRSVILWPDADAEGAKHMARVAVNLQGITADVLTIAWPEAPAKGDAADFVARGLKRSDFDALVAAARTKAAPAGLALSYLWEASYKAVEELDRFHAGDFSRFVPTGIPSLNRKLGGGLRRGTLTLVGASTGDGKSTILQLFCEASAERDGALLVSPEMSAADLAERDIIRRSGVSRWRRNPWRPLIDRDDATEAHMRAACVAFERRLPLLVLDRPGVTLDEIATAATEAKRRHPALGLIAIDYAQEVADLDPRAPRYLTVGAVAQRSVELARALDVAVVVASQVNVIRKGKGPAEYAFRESAILEHKAHNVLVFVVEWETDSTGRRRVESAAFRATKNRSGPLFELGVRFDPALYLVADSDEGGPA